MEMQKPQTEEEKVKDFFKESRNPAIIILKELVIENEDNKEA